ncbi:hypothetical protein [Mycolicibacterium confluentis]|uniref:Uncharacterized protein n=1 Tax=Mycolicibacterium confluentis TaxID=28047 RepID=A0A7I7Y4P2_9MYCO|nr:hypothetical protein [Mycolicibacterium confluentis]MCV7318990.1 hypothetical protein [Mycolicibacterium confluentis]BBZ36599.1 hypothetical protein MCNF_52040 [Mycolicibacterium confluentis]
MTADPGDLAEQATPLESPEEEDLGELPIEADPADYVEQHEAVDVSDEDYPNDRE